MITPLSDALAERGFETLTDVQQAVTAPELAQSDLLVSAQTGSGKTVGFGLAIAPTLMEEDGTLPPSGAPLALVVAPTRELALQVQRELAWLYEKTGAWIVSCIGGMDARTERRALERGSHIVVGTPGRLRDHIERGALDLSSIRAVVLDEADEMLDLGFREDLEFMLAEAPAERRTLLFSATVPPAIEALAKTYQRDAKRVTTITKGQQHTDIDYQAIQVAQQDAEHGIINLLRYHGSQTAIVFANTRAAVTRLTTRLANRGFAVVPLSGELSQDERSHALQALRDGRANVCVATDVAARGIDLPNLELVIHADLPQNTEALLHRSGRTGRAGRKGISALIVPDKAVGKAQRLLKWAKINAEWTFAPGPDEIRTKDEERLMALPAWTDEVTDEEAVFAERLLADFTPQQIATACLRLYQGRLSAPEELNQPGQRPERKERAPREDFGPSGWIALSVGRQTGAEPRWLLPMLCNAGGLDKSQIGRIRVFDTQSFVELAETAVPELLSRVDAAGILDKDIRAWAVDGLPEAPARGPRPGGARPPRRDDDKPRAPRPPRREDDRPVREDRPRLSADSDRPKPRAEGDKPFRKTERAEGDRPFRKTDGDKPARKPAGDKPFRKADGDKPFRKSERSDKTDKPFRKSDKGDKPFAKPADKGGKPNRKADGDAKPRKPFAGAANPGQKLTRGGKPAGKPGGKPTGKPGPKGKPAFKGKGGDAAPRRKG
ncbi:DEAD/DEAH box helicase [Tropicibacter alexandrii]|uniref:DEAD/DEAH box helicase n=1 Tax=Tropicibacter alexandrii TaxID=2267683 RepID=UPI000EF529C7|nr:DEAD/DEAH box helicase [Tropicibacter alexandrii]